MSGGHSTSFDDVGTQAVSRALQHLGPEYGFELLDGVLIDCGSHVRRYDHVVVDKHGIITIDSKVRTGATVYGRSDDRHWAAIMSGGRRLSFDNPLDCGHERSKALQTALIEATGNPRFSGHVDHLIVFSGASLAHLDLSPHDRRRVISLEDLDHYFAQRRVRLGDARLTKESRLVVIDALRSLDRSSDPDVRARYERERRARRERARMGRARGSSSASNGGTVLLAPLLIVLIALSVIAAAWLLMRSG